MDAVASALVKDELQFETSSPFLDAVHAVLRGSRRGRLAPGTRLPPLVEDINQRMTMLDLPLKRSPLSGHWSYRTQRIWFAVSSCITLAS